MEFGHLQMEQYVIPASVLASATILAVGDDKGRSVARCPEQSTIIRE